MKNSNFLGMLAFLSILSITGSAALSSAKTSLNADSAACCKDGKCCDNKDCKGECCKSGKCTHDCCKKAA